MINQLYAGVQNYFEAIPKDTLKMVSQGLLTTFVVSTVVSQSLSKGYQAAVLTVLATTICGLVTPIFKALYDDVTFSSSNEVIRVCLSAICACTIAIATGAPQNVMRNLPVVALLYATYFALNILEVNLNTCRMVPLFPIIY